MGRKDDGFETERRWRWFGRVMLAVMALALVAIALLADK